MANLLYGQRGQGIGSHARLRRQPEHAAEQTDGMFTDEMVQAVAAYEANLHLDGEADDLPGGGRAPLTDDQATSHVHHHHDHEEP